jgi:hypothetical protein
LPEVHAAIVNDDWDLAIELIGPDDFGAGVDMFNKALAARSVKWVEKIIAAGYNIQNDIAISPAVIIRLAEIDPQGLAKKLKGLDYKIIPRMIEQAKTEEGKQALKALMKDATNHS